MYYANIAVWVIIEIIKVNYSKCGIVLLTLSLEEGDLDKRSIHETNSLSWDTKGNDVLGATALPLYGGRIYRRIKLKKQNNFCHPQMCCCRRGETCFSILIVNYQLM